MAFLDKYAAMNQLDPLSSLKEEIQSILRDYRNFWDVYAELLQNSVDAINQRYRLLNDSTYYQYHDFHSRFPDFEDPNFTGKIQIKVDSRSNSITIMDNGIGIEKHQLVDALLPKYSGKKIKHDYGFKGYGLSFVAFVSREFSLQSRFFTDTESYEYSVSNLFDWVSNGTSSPIFPDDVRKLHDSDLHDWNTKVYVRLDDDYKTRFDAVAALDTCKILFDSSSPVKSVERFNYILRTKTAIGNTKGLFSKPPIVPIEINLDLIWPDGKSEKYPIPYSYYHPIDHSEISVYAYEFGDYITQMNAANFVRGFRGLSHVVKSQTIGSRKPLKCDIHLSSISLTRLGNIEQDLGLHLLDDPGAKITNGIFLSIDGMPTGIRLDSWDKKGGAFKRYYAIVDCNLDISNTLDSGRKGITSYYARLLDEHIVDLLNQEKIGNSDTFSSYASRDLDIGRGTPPGGDNLTIPEFQTDINTAALRTEGDLEMGPILVEKVRKYSPLLGLPHSEQEVIILFYSLIARDLIKGYKVVYQAGPEKVYDAAFEYMLPLISENIEPTDPIGFGSIPAQDLKRKNETKYDHTKLYPYKSTYPQLCVEFKITIGGLLSELGRQTNKDAHQIDLLVVWDTTVPSQIKSGTYTLADTITAQRLFHGTTHRLGIIGSRNTDINVVSLKDILKQLP